MEPPAGREEQEALKLLEEYGYPAAEGAPSGGNRGGTGPGGVLCPGDFSRSRHDRSALFEEDALNLKLYLKARLSGKNPDPLVSSLGSWPPDVMRICVEAEDFSFGRGYRPGPPGIFEETDPGRVSCRVDAPSYAHTPQGGGKAPVPPADRLAQKVRRGKNRITRARLEGLHRNPQDYPAAFLPLSFPDGADASASARPEGKPTREELLAQEEERLKGRLRSSGTTRDRGYCRILSVQEK